MKEFSWLKDLWLFRSDVKSLYIGSSLVMSKVDCIAGVEANVEAIVCLL